MFRLNGNIRIYHECKDGIEKNPTKGSPIGIIRLAPVMTIGDCEGLIFLSHPHMIDGSFSYSPFNTAFLY